MGFAIRRLWTLAASLALAASCGKAGRHRPNGGALADELETKAARYAELLPSVQDADGFIETDTCDSVHWSALVGALSPAVRLEAAFDASGKLHRRPPRYPECYPEFSKSENSRDAYLMVLVYALARGDKALVQRVFRYGRAHGWIMGEGPMSRVFFTANMRALYGQALEHLGGRSEPERLLPIVWDGGATGYQAHLAVVSVLAFGMIHGWVPDDGLAVLASQHARQPRNPLFAAAYYRYSGSEAARDSALETLRDERLFPPDRLPTSDDRCEGWLPQRDLGPDWLSCSGGRRHSGGDFLFTHAVLTGRL